MSIVSDNKPIFKLCSLTPIGFKVPNYPIEICLVCRGPLLSVCENCVEKKNEICHVIKNMTDANFYHSHCFDLIKKSETTEKKS